MIPWDRYQMIPAMSHPLSWNILEQSDPCRGIQGKAPQATKHAMLCHWPPLHLRDDCFRTALPFSFTAAYSSVDYSTWIGSLAHLKCSSASTSLYFTCVKLNLETVIGRRIFKILSTPTHWKHTAAYLLSFPASLQLTGAGMPLCSCVSHGWP